MTEDRYRPTWHQESYDRTMAERLPELLAERLPLAGYRYEITGETQAQISIAVSSNGNGQVEVCYADLPRPDGDGLFYIEDEEWIFVPYIDGDDPAANHVHCVSDWQYDFFAEHLGEATADIAWSESLLLAWLPLDRWLTEALAAPVKERQLFQRLDTTNWLSRRTHGRRLWMPDRQSVVGPDDLGRTCPIETPEGPNAGKVLSIAVGAAVEDGRLVIVDDRPGAALGLSASMIPCPEHDDPFYLLMGANMMRQWLPYAEPEAALVQTGNEPGHTRFLVRPQPAHSVHPLGGRHLRGWHRAQ